MIKYRVILSKKNAITIFIRYFENDTILGITIYHQTICSPLVPKLFGASLCSSWNLLNPPGYPRKPAVQCVHSPVVARKNVNPELIGESLLSTNCLTLLLHLLPQVASGASVGDFSSSREWLKK